MVFLVGEAGIGKSRLLLELRRRVGSVATGRKATASPSAAPWRSIRSSIWCAGASASTRRTTRAPSARKSSGGVARGWRGSRGHRALSAGPLLGGSGRRRGAGHEPGPAPRRDLRGVAAAARPRRRAAAPGAGHRGSPLDRQRERAVPGDAGGQHPRPARAARLHLPAGLREPVRRTELLHADRARARLSAEDSARMAAAVLAADDPPGRAAVLDRREGRGQPLLRRGAYEVAGGERRPAAGGRAPGAHAAAHCGGRPRVHTRHHRRSHRSARRGPQAHAPARRR